MNFNEPLFLEKLSSLDFEEAENAMKDVLKPTPLIKSDLLSSMCENQVYLKPECLQKTGSFKIRGAYNKIRKLTDDERKKGVVASSAGNHAQGVAFSAKKIGINATIVMPTTTPLIKVNSTKSYGANVILHGEVYDEAYEESRRLEKEHGYVYIHPFNDFDVIEGQGTIANEILKELPDADYILVPVGGGGLISGIVLSALRINPKIRIIGVEPTGANAMKQSLINGHLTNLETVNTIADGVAVKNPGDITYNIIKNNVSEIIEVSDFDIMESFLLLLQNHKIVSENSGTLTVSALNKLKCKNKKVVSLISGGNIDVLTISSLINKGLISMGRIFCFSVTLPDVPGQLLKIAQALAETGANVVKLDHNQFKSYNRFNNVALEVTVETNGHSHIEQIVDNLIEKGYHITRIY
ncbi:threonine ammonia-lyase [Peptoanaerobacter stomatis]|uniref:L-threonine dehydratase catabolic TdcB n=1 Tax=Peptoanaerobacter stomatis TaxID=796937 RepID=J6H788_9FIRM|nr:threonine ammonia-lyase [Peptoanaerobacter stomatis]EJU21105.1 threonine ammonia-lyase [Peptoanaerobacter stomatis]NWO26011.1 threonine ammonia-lyase [Peptostreptococcaceae bacterium oral taxon 081]